MAVTAPDNGGGVCAPHAPATVVDEPLDDLDRAPAAPDDPPRRGDTLTLYTLPQAARWLGLAPDTLRGLARSLLPRRFLSKPCPGKTMMSADAIHQLADFFHEVDWDALRAAPPAAGVRAHRRRSCGS